MCIVFGFLLVISGRYDFQQKFMKSKSISQELLSLISIVEITVNNQCTIIVITIDPGAASCHLDSQSVKS